MSNLRKRLVDQLPKSPLQVGDVTASSGGISTVELIGGGTLRVRGTATIGSRVFVRSGAIEGPAPTLPLIELEV